MNYLTVLKGRFNNFSLLKRLIQGTNHFHTMHHLQKMLIGNTTATIHGFLITQNIYESLKMNSIG